MSDRFHAIIIAAGVGRRCRPFTEETPKCLLPVNGKSILEHQLDALRANGITEIAVVRGYRADKLKDAALRYYDNLDYKRNNILNSLMAAEQELQGNCLVTYGDIVYTDAVVRTALQSRSDLAVVIDTEWRARYAGRCGHPVSEAEKAMVSGRGSVVEIGKHIEADNAGVGEFIGMMKLSGRGCELFRTMFHRAKSMDNGGPFRKAANFRQAYLTDMLQEMVENGVFIEPVYIRGSWVEVDTAEDYEYANHVFKTAVPPALDS